MDRGPSETRVGLFKRVPRSRLLADMRWLEKFGRFELDTQHSGIAIDDIGSIGSLCVYASHNQASFLAELQAVVDADQGGFATFGAACLAWEAFGGDCLHIPAALPLIDAGIEFKRSRGLPTASLTGYEMQRFIQLREQAG